MLASKRTFRAYLHELGGAGTVSLAAAVLALVSLGLALALALALAALAALAPAATSTSAAPGSLAHLLQAYITVSMYSGGPCCLWAVRREAGVA